MALLCAVYLMACTAAETRTRPQESLLINDRSVPLLAKGTRKDLPAGGYRCGIYPSDGDTPAKFDTRKPVAAAFLVQTELLPETSPAEW